MNSMLSDSKSPNRPDVEVVLLELKDAALKATRNADIAFFEGYLSDDAIAATPVGVVDRSGILAAVAAGAVRSEAVVDTAVVVLNEAAGIVTYRATFASPAGPWSAFVTTVYRRESDGTWHGVLYQQTRLL
jgi:hypothetical protein